MTTSLKRVFVVLLFACILIIPLFIWFSEDAATALLNIFLAPILFSYYYIQRIKPLKRIDWLVISILLAIFATDVANVNSQINHSHVSLSLIFVILYQAGYIFLMRYEKVRVTFKGFKDIIKIVIPSLVFFAIFGIFFFDHPSNTEYILILISDIETTLLIILILFRKKDASIFYSGAIGACLLGLTNILYLFLKINYLSINYIDLMICSYWFSHFFLIHSILQSLNSQELAANKE